MARACQACCLDSAFHPVLPRLPLPSRRNTMSSSFLHCFGFTPHFILYCASDDQLDGRHCTVALLDRRHCTVAVVSPRPVLPLQHVGKNTPIHRCRMYNQSITSCFGKVCKHAALFELQAILGLGSGALTNSLGCVSNVLRVLRVPSLQSFRAPRPFAPFTELAIILACLAVASFRF